MAFKEIPETRSRVHIAAVVSQSTEKSTDQRGAEDDLRCLSSGRDTPSDS